MMNFDANCCERLTVTLPYGAKALSPNASVPKSEKDGLVTARKLARQFRYSPEELIAEIEALRARAKDSPLSKEEKEKIMKGDFDL